MAAKKSSLAQAIAQLKSILKHPAERQDRDWTQRMDQALEAVEQAARRQRAGLKDPEGRVVDVDSSLNPSPTVARRSDELRQQLDELLHEAAALRWKLPTVHPSATGMDASTAAGALTVAPEEAEAVDFGVCRERIEQLLQRFEHYDEEEAELIQESVTTDLGAGD